MIKAVRGGTVVLHAPLSAATVAPLQSRAHHSKQSSRPSRRIVAAPSRIAAARRRTKSDGSEADRAFGSGRIAARRAPAPPTGRRRTRRNNAVRPCRRRTPPRRTRPR
ncbi:hypothetical protein MBELCI_0824 [Limimaricola cinnabarinus LL-001]|uniref:Uncharacterized protein n=1 Tax=Limimaricola cinnabarinus LL-001 TaxID=1337093 RepID=U2Z113_9RHOB|nr:hypothetical protein MBELCI_0824 [Limimaricola cinnabarinus LL-001]